MRKRRRERLARLAREARMNTRKEQIRKTPVRNVLLGKTLKNDDPRIVFYDTGSKKHVLTFNANAESGKEFKNDNKKKDDKTITLKVRKTKTAETVPQEAMEFRIKIGDTKEKICSVHKYLDAYTMAKETDKWKDNTIEGLKLRKKINLELGNL